MAKIRVELDARKVMGRINAKAKRVLPLIANQIREDCNLYVRMYMKTLRASSYTASELDKGRIVWNTPYAKRVYYTGTPSKDVNPGASIRWCEKAKRIHGKGWAEKVQKEMNK